MKRTFFAVVLVLLCAFSAQAKGFYSGAFAHPAPAAAPSSGMAARMAQASNGGLYAQLNWTASASCSNLPSGATCAYNVFRGTTSGGEGTTAINASLISGTTYSDAAVALTSSNQTFYYTVETVVTLSGGIVVSSTASNEASVTFPAQPLPPTLVTGTLK